MPSLPTLPTAPVTLTGVSTGTFGTPVYNWITFLAAPPTFVGTASGTSVTTGGTGVALAIDGEEIDSVGGHDNVTNNTRYTAQYAGRYLCIGSCVWPSNATGRRYSALRKNGTTEYLDANNTIPAATGTLRTQAARMIFLAVNDYVEVMGFQDSGGTLNTVTGTLQVLWTGSS